MGQYHKIVNLDKKQYIHPHQLGAGLKLWEQLASHPGTGAALIVLLASASNGAGGGDITQDPIVGSWRGDRIAMIGDYDDDVSYEVGPFLDGPGKPREAMLGKDIYDAADDDIKNDWTDVSIEVSRVIEKELSGEFSGGGWREWKRTK